LAQQKPKKVQWDQEKEPIRNIRKHPYDPAIVQAALQNVQEQLDVLAVEKYGKYRGKHTMLQLQYKNRRSKRHAVNTQTAMAKIADLVYLQFAHQHGAMRWKEVQKLPLGKLVFQNPQAKIQITPKQMKQILLEQWRYGKSPIYDGLYKKHQAQQQQAQTTQQAQQRAAAARQAKQQQFSNNQKTEDEPCLPF
jgi:hypothetical protein